ncbi:MAG: hypothetical protein ACYCZ6_17725 [Polaromonas sp.]
MDDWAWGQFALVGLAAAGFFAAGAREKYVALNIKTWFEIAQAVVIVVLLFILLSEGRGCHHSVGSSEGNCQPSPQGMICDDQ